MKGDSRMSNSVGVAVLDAFDTQPLKRAALWFDRIAVLQRTFLAQGATAERDAMRADLQYLKENDLIYSLPNDWHEAPLGDDPEAQALEEERSSILSFAPFSVLLTPAQRRAQLHLLWAGQARLASMWIRRTGGIDAFPILNSFSEIEVPEARRKDQVVRVILKALPMPGGTTPWERIRDFREDKDAKRAWGRLRDWANEIGKKEYTANEIEEKLEYLIREYKKRAGEHITESTKKLLETVVVTTAEIAESTVKLRFSKLAKRLFSIRAVPLTLLKADPDVPGKEVAYIAGAQKEFGD